MGVFRSLFAGTFRPVRVFGMGVFGVRMIVVVMVVMAVRMIVFMVVVIIQIQAAFAGAKGITTFAIFYV